MKILKPRNENGDWTNVDKIVGNSIFLGGPVPRSNYENDWRNEAIKILDDACFDGTVIVPTNEKYDETNPIELELQMKWEHKMMNACDVLYFNLDKSDEYPGFTTNYECGEWFNTHNKIIIVYCPEENMQRANKYIITKAAEKQIRICGNFKESLKAVVRYFLSCNEWRLDNYKSITEHILSTYKALYGDEIMLDTGNIFHVCHEALAEITNDFKRKKLFGIF